MQKVLILGGSGLVGKALIEENLGEEGYFALLSNRNNEFPDELRITNKMVINYLI